MTRSAPNRLVSKLALVAVCVGLAQASPAQGLQPVYPGQVESGQPRERAATDAPTMSDESLPYGDWLDAGTAGGEASAADALPYGDILLFADEAALDLRAAPSVVESLLWLEFEDALQRPLPSDTWMQLGDVWLRVEPLPFRADEWTRVRLRVGDFSDRDVERAEALLSTLALRLVDRLEAERAAQALDVDGILAEAGVALDDGDTSSAESAPPAYFDNAWIASAYASDPVATSPGTEGEGWVPFWSPTWGWWYVPADRASELAAWLAVDVPSNDAGTQVVVVHDSSYGFGSGASVCAGYGYGYGPGWSSGWGLHYGSTYGSSWTWGLLGQYTHYTSFSPWYSPYYACDPWWWNGCSPWWWSSPFCDPWIGVHVDVTVSAPGDDPADGDDDDAGTPDDGVGDDGVGGVTRRQLLADGRDRTPTRDEPASRRVEPRPTATPILAEGEREFSRGGKPTVEADPVLTRRPVVARPVGGQPLPAATPVRRAPVALGGLRSAPVVRSSVAMPDVLRRGPIGTTPSRPGTPVARTSGPSVTLQPWPAPVATRHAPEWGRVDVPAPAAPPIVTRTSDFGSRTPRLLPTPSIVSRPGTSLGATRPSTPVLSTPASRTTTPVLRSAPRAPAPSATTSRPQVTHTPSVMTGSPSPRASSSAGSVRSGTSGSSTRGRKSKKNR